MTLSNRNWISILSLPLLACLPVACASEAGDQESNQTADNVSVTETKEVTTSASPACAPPPPAR